MIGVLVRISCAGNVGERVHLVCDGVRFARSTVQAQYNLTVDYCLSFGSVIEIRQQRENTVVARKGAHVDILQ